MMILLLEHFDVTRAAEAGIEKAPHGGFRQSYMIAVSFHPDFTVGPGFTPGQLEPL
jgi:hypothetical protein